MFLLDIYQENFEMSMKKLPSQECYEINDKEPPVAIPKFVKDKSYPLYDFQG